MKQKISLLFLSLLLLFTLTACSAYYKQACDYCDEEHWCKEYAMSDGMSAYICKDCSSMCMFCEDVKATEHYESLLGIVVFVCDDCYQEILEWNS